MPVDVRGRHHNAAPAPIVGWKCPACDASNTGPLEQGCVSCGSGKPGQFVGIDPPASRMVVPSTVEHSVSDDPISDGFVTWWKQRGHALDLKDVRSLAYEAFQAGFQAAVARVVQPELPISGTAESRTIVAALRLFLENVLPTATDEIASGEFLSVQQTEALIQRIERKG